jgi:hypothetical protein
MVSVSRDGYTPMLILVFPLSARAQETVSRGDAETAEKENETSPREPSSLALYQESHLTHCHHRRITPANVSREGACLHVLLSVICGQERERVTNSA